MMPKQLRPNKKKCSLGNFKGSEGEQHPKASAWRPSFVLCLRGLVMDNANLRDHQKGRLGILAECLENAFLLPEDMQELRSF